MVINAREVGSRCEVRRPLDTLRIKGEKVGFPWLHWKKSGVRSQKSGVLGGRSISDGGSTNKIENWCLFFTDFA